MERAFGKLKGTFRIHRTKPSFGINTQVKVIYATAALMNYLLEYGDITDDDDIPVDLMEEDPNSSENNFTIEGKNGIVETRLRKEMAQKMWQGYIQYLAN